MMCFRFCRSLPSAAGWACGAAVRAGLPAWRRSQALPPHRVGALPRRGRSWRGVPLCRRLAGRRVWILLLRAPGNTSSRPRHYTGTRRTSFDQLGVSPLHSLLERGTVAVGTITRPWSRAGAHLLRTTTPRPGHPPLYTQSIDHRVGRLSGDALAFVHRR